MWKYIEILLINFKVSLIKQMSYKLNFVLRLIADTVFLVIYYVFFDLLFRQIPTINGWCRDEVIIIMGTFHMINSLFLSLFFTNVVQIPKLIKDGGIDGYILKPVQLKFLLSTSNIDISSLINLLFGFSIVLISIHSLQVHVSTFALIRYIMFVLLGVYTHYNIFFLIMISAFWIGDSSWGVGFFMQFNNFADKPISLFRGGVSRLITFVIPIGLIANAPASVILNKGQEKLTVIMVVISVMIYLVTKYVWHRGLIYYEATSI